MMLTERFADFIYRTMFEDLPGDIVSLAKERILDSVGAILAGAGNWVCRDQFLTTCKAQGLGAAAAAGRLLGLTKEQIANALGLAGPYASGLMEATVTGQLSKCVMVGNAAASGMAAVYYAREGMEGTTNVFEGKDGFFAAKSQDVDVEAVCAGLGERFLITNTYSKMYPTCCHERPQGDREGDGNRSSEREYHAYPGRVCHPDCLFQSHPAALFDS